MTRIAVSGHRGLSTQTTSLVRDGLRQQLSPYRDDLVGVTCLADGADQLFAEVVLDLGGTIEVVVPAERYLDSLPPETHAAYQQLLAKARLVRQLGFVESTSESHMEASAQMLNDVDLLLAVWDGLPARGYGGTADVVSHARQLGIPVVVVWPDKASR